MTSGNGTANNNNNNNKISSSNNNSRRLNGEAKAAQAIVKSDILTHLIEGFVIQEGAEPFPVSLSDRQEFFCLFVFWNEYFKFIFSS